MPTQMIELPAKSWTEIGSPLTNGERPTGQYVITNVAGPQLRIFKGPYDGDDPSVSPPADFGHAIDGVWYFDFSEDYVWVYNPASYGITVAVTNL